MVKDFEIFDNDIVQQLENNGLKREGREQQIKLLLCHAHTAIRMYWSMSHEDRVLATDSHKKCRFLFPLRKFLKERKTNSRKSYLPPAPPTLKKEYKEKTDKISLSPARVKRTLNVRKEEFWNELLTYEEKYGLQMLKGFYYYWAEQVTGQRKMRLELETSWETKHRLAAWAQRSFNKNDEAATIRLERAKQGGKDKVASQNSAQQEAVARQRAADNARREEELDRARAESVSFDEYRRRLDAQASETS